jgi:exosortase B
VVMTAEPSGSRFTARAGRQWSREGLLWLGFAAMFLPSYWRAAHGLWQVEEHSHLPMILMVSLWLLWRELPNTANIAVSSNPWQAWTLLLIGLPLYVIGRVLGSSSLEFLAHLLVFVSIFFFTRGWGHVRSLWFPLLYLVFFIPLPATVVDLVTSPLKIEISSVVTSILAAAGYPIARSGVIISIGQYQLLVADACSGINSMLSLLALGTLFMYLMRRPSFVHNALMFLAIIPIAFMANIVRVIVLVLVTFYQGDEAGQGFLHGAAGIVVLLVALGMFFLLDAVLSRWVTPSGAAFRAV